MENYVAAVIPHLQQWWPVIILLAYLVGIGFAMVSLAQSISHKHRFNRSTAVWTLWAAVLLLNIPAFMLPLRSASPWKEGSLLLRTQDGKLFPFAPNSSEQAAWIDLGVAPMGGGKSVFLNALNFAFVTQAGLSRLPWVSIIDVGPSSSGLITLLQENLPENKKHLAAYHRLRMKVRLSASGIARCGCPCVLWGQWGRWLPYSRV